MKLMEYSDVLRRMHHNREMRSLVLNAPAHLRKELEPAGFTDNTGTTLRNEFTLLFAGHKADLNKFVPLAIESTKPGAPFWIAYPKAGSGLDQEKLNDEMHLYDYEPVTQVTLDAGWMAIRFRPINPVTVEESETDRLKPPSW